MIDLEQTRESMLAEIAASPRTLGVETRDPSSDAFLRSDEARLVLSGPTRDSILPALRRALAARFPGVPAERFARDLDLPLKRGLGNAYKRGNRLDPDRSITAEVVATSRGAFVEITDEGDGFDFRSTLGKFRRRESFATNRGGGFESFEASDSVISYADHGRKFLLRFLAAGAGNEGDLAASPQFMTGLFSLLSRYRTGDVRLDSCAIEKLGDCRPEQPEYRYLLTQTPNRLDGRPLVLTGRVLSEGQARTEYTVAKQLRKESMKEGADLVVPKPRNVFKRHPRLVLYELDRSESLLARISSPERLHEALPWLLATASGLRKLHRSRITFSNGEGPAGETERLRRLEDTLVRAPFAGAPDSADRVRRIFRTLEPFAARLAGFDAPVPIHGSFGWDCVLGTEMPLRLFRLGSARLSHPGLDLGGLLADLPSPALGANGAVPALREKLVRAYLEGESSGWVDDLPGFTALAHLERLARIRGVPANGVDQAGALLASAERELGIADAALR